MPVTTGPTPSMAGGTAPRATHGPTREVVTFLAVGGAGYVTDVVAFNWLRGEPLLGGPNPLGAKVAAVAVAMVVTYLGNSLLTWRDYPSTNRRREVTLFVVFNLAGLLISVLTLAVSHNMLGLTSRLSDNISGNVIGVGLGTAFRYWSYRRFVFNGPPGAEAAPRTPGGADAGGGALARRRAAQDDEP